MQPEGYAHDYSLVETRIKQLQAPADRQRMIGQGVRALGICGGLCAILLSSALAWRIVSEPRIELVEAPSQQAVPQPPAGEQVGPLVVPAPAADTDAVVTTNFTLFRSTEAKVGSRAFDLTAGHKYLSETDRAFSSAWCYTEALVDGVRVHIELGEIATQGGSPTKLDPTGATLESAGLTRFDHAALFRACPWLEGNPNLVRSRVERSYTFEGEVTAATVDQLIAAVAAGAREIVLTSPGGLLGEAIRGYEALASARVNTTVQGECASACTILFLAGASRTLLPGGWIGVHQWRSEDETPSESETQLLSAELLKLIAGSGVSEEFYIAGASKPADEIRKLTPSELAAWGVLRPSDAE